jgi:uncharacterized damage-inducible protein DinB
VIADVPSFLRYFDGIHARTVRDVGALPEEAERWVPDSATDGEAAWGAPRVVAHVAEARRFFAGAFLGEGWVWDDWPDDLSRRGTWLPALERSRDELHERLAGADDARLTTRVPMLDQPDRTIAGWRALMMLVEHEVHHRSQLATYAGLNAWPVHQIFGRTNEWVVSQRDRQRRSDP